MCNETNKTANLLKNFLLVHSILKVNITIFFFQQKTVGDTLMQQSRAVGSNLAFQYCNRFSVFFFGYRLRISYSVAAKARACQVSPIFLHKK